MNSPVPGFEKQTQLLLHQITSGAFPHALLLHGPDGNGLPLMARFLAMSLMCNHKESTPCGNCSFCRQIENLAHPDVYWIIPVFKTSDAGASAKFIHRFRDFFSKNPFFTLNDWMNELESENKQLQIGVEETRNLLQHLSMTSYSGKWKIVIIWGIEKMNIEASNKILKILEEPDPFTRFICISHHPEELLPTILSRLQQITFPPLTPEHVSLCIQQYYPDFPKEKIKAASLYAEGIVRAALQWMESEEKEHEMLEIFRQGMRIALRFHPDAAQEWTEKCASFSREKQKQLLEYALQLIHKCLLLNTGLKELCYLLPAEEEFLTKFSPFVKTERIHAWEETFSLACEHLERNANSKILFMDLLFRCNELLHSKSTA